ncbi:acyloxyacyl hydrolase [Microcaecilia unicolor]|uniref:Acyloxyacyl hydrolase n=1 Tax=Microcaecilia unicolor TaxID=1415580 RepID=A0A6P7XX18_9AMPH|nr:acyloxyacyl hydrolase [Microcaecilia unicolor]
MVPTAPRYLLLLLLLLQGSSSAALPANGRTTGTRKAAGDTGEGLPSAVTCTGCVLLVSVIEQLAQVHNSTVQKAMERLCSYLPEHLYLKMICQGAAEFFGPDLIKLFTSKANADVVCHALNLCRKQPGLPYCHLYPPPKEGLEMSIKKAQRIVKSSVLLRKLTAFPSICSLPFLDKICQKIKHTIDYKVPLKDFDQDNFSDLSYFRGYDWRGKDCNDLNDTVYPGRSPRNWDIQHDSNCNGIWGIDPEDGIPYEKKFCEGTDSKGVILLADSAGAHFHIPPEWLTAETMSLKTFSNLPLTIFNEFDWPQFSGYTGFLNSTIGGWTESIYLHLRDRNRCNHRDYQSISKNGGSSKNIMGFIESLARKKKLDKPAIVIYSMVGNDVCNEYTDTLAHMTSPKDLHDDVMKVLKYLNSRLPDGSHVILQGLADGRFLWDHLHNRYHPLGQLNKDITYEQLYTFLSCIQFNPCNGWMSLNETLRNLTSQRAFQLSSVLEEIATLKFSSFDMLYVNFSIAAIADEWHKLGGKPWQLIEPTDGFHPSQNALALGAKLVWQEVLQKWPHVLGKPNPFNKDIVRVFGDQGGH